MLYAIAAALVLVLDQGLKYFVTLKIALNDGVMPFLPGVMSLVNIHNSGMAFGALSEAGFRWCFVVIAVVFAGVVAYVLAAGKVKKRSVCWLLTLVAAGGLGNAIDRALYGYVVDMFRTDFMEFAVFNVADIFVTVCGILLCVSLILPEKKAPVEAEETTGTPAAQKEKTGFVLKSKKRPAPEVPEEVKERRRAGKLYDDPAPIDSQDPFAEFDGTSAPAAPEPSPEAPEKKPPATAEEELAGLTVDDILKEIL